jgi:Outer membrane protein beta-barrel domain
MKKIILSVAVIALALGANAQKGSSEDEKPLKISVGVEAALPLSDFGKTYSFGVGASAQVDYNVAENLDVTGNIGYISFSGKTVTTPSQTILGITIPGTSIKYPALGYIPVLAGAKYHFSDNLYGSAQLGVTIASASGGGGSSSAFTYAPGIGYKFTENLDALLKYTGYSGKGGGSSSTVGLRVAYTF